MSYIVIENIMCLVIDKGCGYILEKGYIIEKREIKFATDYCIIKNGSDRLKISKYEFETNIKKM